MLLLVLLLLLRADLEYNEISEIGATLLRGALEVKKPLPNFTPAMTPTANLL